MVHCCLLRCMLCYEKVRWFFDNIVFWSSLTLEMIRNTCRSQALHPRYMAEVVEKLVTCSEYYFKPPRIGKASPTQPFPKLSLGVCEKKTHLESQNNCNEQVPHEIATSLTHRGHICSAYSAVGSSVSMGANPWRQMTNQRFFLIC